MYHLKGYVRLVPQGVAPFHLGSGLLTSGKVTRAPELPTSILDFLFLLEWSLGWQGWDSFFGGDVVLSPTALF